MTTSEPAFSPQVADHLESAGVVAVLVIDDADHALPLAEALLAGGVSAIELTLRTESAFESLQRIASRFPEILAGVGTVLFPDQVRRARELGAAFGVAPGLNPAIVESAKQVGLPFAPGICTPSDIENAVACGCKLLKFFPAGGFGGIHYLRTIAGPYAHLGLRYIPLGGVNADNAEDYLKQPIVHSIGGSWIAPRDEIARGGWDTIRRRAEQATSLIQRIRGQA
jgi:2-dehydro-3-deoxyphosphogluconate aldolase/(4S)-4-hydroxy-2-oxoglutarate aldolase